MIHSVFFFPWQQLILHRHVDLEMGKCARVNAVCLCLCMYPTGQISKANKKTPVHQRNPKADGGYFRHPSNQACLNHV